MLVTDWKTIGTAGDTIDGREITEQDLKDAAESYDKEEYTAVINSDHALWLYGNFGHVEAVRLSTDKKGRTILQAKLAPNSRLIEKNKNGQGLFTSMELWPNFANTGKTYLSGLAVTDEPASLGTSMLKLFAKQPGGKPDRIYAKACEESITLEDPNIEGEDVQGLMSRLAKFFKTDPAFSAKPEPHDEDQETEMSKELLEKISQQQEALTSALSTLAEGINQHFSKEAPEGEKPEGNKEETPEPEAPEVVSAEQFNQLATKTNELADSVKALTDTFNKLKEEKPGTHFNKNEGDSDKITFV
ncbi:GPO family capsid scaffolding protein [Endozoicomonas sp. GU-1]|uniref:GPO family capsid scaffolding protein n=1 Tax=Endozoicomonas sp. GU-1 TaxID=3009078 RepID=UPI0022B4D3F8|nr:GPO family capsid scaffolding protein [Endozoicomonas sp. GU-1]WBA86515.1 GPO family capsid scaffolding protein [Endozoicomonas sp. GU-1]